MRILAKIALMLAGLLLGLIACVFISVFYVLIYCMISGQPVPDEPPYDKLWVGLLAFWTAWLGNDLSKKMIDSLVSRR